MATLQQRYDAALLAYDQLMTGKAVKVVVDQNGERIEYQTANANKLSIYIGQLRAELFPALGRGPLQPWF